MLDSKYNRNISGGSFAGWNGCNTPSHILHRGDGTTVVHSDFPQFRILGRGFQTLLACGTAKVNLQNNCKTYLMLATNLSTSPTYWTILPTVLFLAKVSEKPENEHMLVKFYLFWADQYCSKTCKHLPPNMLVHLLAFWKLQNQNHFGKRSGSRLG